MKILVFTTDVIPLPGLPTSGTALRTFGLIQGLKSHGHEVVISVPTSALEGLKKAVDVASLAAGTQQLIRELERTSFDAANQNTVLAEVGPDAILCGHWPAMTLSTKPSQALIVDLAGPHMLERHYQGAPNQVGAALGKLAVIANADYFIVSGPKQRLYFLSYLLRAAVDRPEQRIVEIVMPMNPELPARPVQSPGRYPRFVFGGVFLPWQNPAPSLRQLKEELTTRSSGSLTLIGGKHPNYDIRLGIYEELFRELAEHPQVDTKPMLPYEEFIGSLANTDVAVDLMQWNLERELAVTIRSTSYLWAGVPVIYNNYADLSRLIERYDAGWCIDPADPQALTTTLDEIYRSPERVQLKSANAERLAREVFSWDKAVEPLLSFLVKPETKRLRETDIIVDFPDSAEYPLQAGTSIEQYFVCRIAGLTKVECRIATHNRSLTKPLSMELYRLEGRGEFDRDTVSRKARHLVAREQLDSAALRNNEWHALDIEPIPDSAGAGYVLRIAADEPDAANTASPWTLKGSPYPLLGLWYGNRQVDQAALCFRTTCAGKLS
ncbi:MAG: hypothetical protein KDD69_08265 [Bdellovibrionales bacterium]|nr:hypothetical protein [Bdellovibrionales bacterium]